MPKIVVSKATVLSPIKINANLLSHSQLDLLTTIHTANIVTFDKDMSGRYQMEGHLYLAIFSFIQENKALLYWVPQFKRQIFHVTLVFLHGCHSLPYLTT